MEQAGQAVQENCETFDRRMIEEFISGILVKIRKNERTITTLKALINLDQEEIEKAVKIIRQRISTGNGFGDLRDWLLSSVHRPITSSLKRSLPIGADWSRSSGIARGSWY
jgi:hypothetical protein